MSSAITGPTEWDWMRRAVDLGKGSLDEPNRSTPAPKVGVVIVKDETVLGQSFRGETGPGRHAEFGLLEQLDSTDLQGATVFTTLEPCSYRSPPKRPCAERLLEKGITEVYIGMYDPNPMIYRAGWKILRDGGIVLKDFPADLRAEIRSDNEAFIDQFRIAIAETGSAAFDYTQNGGRFIVKSSAGEFVTRWTPRGADSIYAYDADHHVAQARYARDFGEIDDPGALDFSNYSVPAAEGEIVVFRNDEGFLLIAITKVFAGPERGHDHYELQINFEVRNKESGLPDPSLKSPR